MVNCYCGSDKSFKDCCQIYINGNQNAPTADSLMRSRYSAYAVGDADYLVNTTHFSTRKFHKKEDVLKWSKSNNWIKLEILSTTETHVKFKAYYIDSKGKTQIHEEISTFIFEKDKWFYADGEY